MCIKTFGGTVKELREQRNMSQEQLAKILGVDIKFIVNIEHNGLIPDVMAARAIAIALQTTIDHLANTEKARVWRTVYFPEEFKNNKNELTINIDTSEVDVLIKKLNQLKQLIVEISELIDSAKN